MKTADWSIAETPTLREQTVSILREAILSGAFRPGEKLVERTLSHRTGVSRTSIREALSQLEAEGLVRRVAGRGMHVTRLSEAEALQIYEARAILEAAMARRFVERASTADFDALEAAIRDVEATARPDLAGRHAAALDRVFDVITRGAGNAVTRQMAAVLRGRVTYLRTITSRVATPERRRVSLRMLKEIHAALEARDADAAERLIRAYIERSAQYAIAVLRTAGDGGDTVAQKE